MLSVEGYLFDGIYISSVKEENLKLWQWKVLGGIVIIHNMLRM